MNKVHKGKTKYILASSVMLLLLAMVLVSNGRTHTYTEMNQCDVLDTVPAKSSSAILTDTARLIINDTNALAHLSDTTMDTTKFKIKKDTIAFKVAKGSLDAPVVYHADDSMVLEVPTKKITLYGKEAKTTYKDNELTAPGIEFNQETGIISAYITKDSTGKPTAFPTYHDKDFKTVSDSIRFNMKNGKGITKGTYTQQGEMFVYADKMKKIDADVFYAYRSRFTTCDLDTPHFAFVSNKIKFINQKLAITGPIHPEIEGVPIPLYFPFGIFPLTQGRHSGFLPPTFTEDETFGLALEGLGYYEVINQFWDVILKSNIYSYGSWTIDVNPRYYKRYHYRGSFDFSYQNYKYNFKGDPDYAVAKTYQINWTHQSDSKAIPGQTFGASVHYGSSTYNTYVTTNPQTPFNNSSNSSINFARTFKAYSYTINGTASQNSITKETDIALPTLSFNLNTFYPFRRKEAAGSLKWYENVGIGLSSGVQTTTSYFDDTTTKAFPQIGKNFQWGANHSVPITLSLPQLGVINIAPSVSYTERWYQQKTIVTADNRYTNNGLDTSVQNGFYTARSMSFAVAFTTKIFGMFNFGKNSEVQAIRHLITPSVSISYTPNMNAGSYYNSYDTLGNAITRSYYESSLYGAFSEQRFGGLTFGIENNIQAKVKSKSDTSTAGVKKITLIDALNITGSYNFLADSFQLSPFAISASTNLFSKINITAGATIDPYRYDSVGQRVNKLAWKGGDGFSIGELTSANLALSTQFKGGDQKKQVPSHSLVQPYTNLDPTTGLPLNDYQQEAAYVGNNPAAHTDFSVPWTLSLTYSLSVSRATTTGIVNNYFSYVTQYVVTQYSNFNATVALTPKWQAGVSGNYDISTQQLGLISLTLARDMHCWQMAISVSNSAVNRFFSISISPKSSILSDLKLDRTRSVTVQPGL